MRILQHFAYICMCVELLDVCERECVCVTLDEKSEQQEEEKTNRAARTYQMKYHWSVVGAACGQNEQSLCLYAASVRLFFRVYY